jgi:hypothetical protein
MGGWNILRSSAHALFTLTHTINMARHNNKCLYMYMWHSG